MKVEVKQVELAAVGADLVVVGLAEGGELPAPIASAAGAEDTPSGFRKTTLLRPDGFPPVLAVGLGAGDELDAERLRVAAAFATKEASRLQAGSLAWAVPESGDPAAAAEALVAGTLLASYRFDRFKSGDSDDTPRLEALTLVGPAELEAPAEV
ncbi:MAG TPA: M17 family peptidase N-terminal domain-containing protein, partial [Solirubrobacterales bacterium]|nr:M17 family peptidase N-terminal domain-containing protein [Solirubrobacterales bacterium]